MENLPVERVTLKVDFRGLIEEGFQIDLDEFVRLMLLAVNLIDHPVGLVDNRHVGLVVLVEGFEQLMADRIS